MAWSAAAACFFGIAGAALATTLIVIYVVHKKKQKALKYKSNDSVRHNGVDYRYDPETKSIVESSAPVRITNDSNNNVKKRSPPSTIDKKPALKSVAQSSEKSTDKKSTNVSKEVQTDPVDENQNNLDNPMSLEEKVNEYFRRNISVPDLVSNSESPNPVNAETLSSPDSSEWSNISSEKSTDSTRKNYKKKVHKSFKKYVNNFIETNCARHSAENAHENSDTLSDADTLSESDNLSSVSNSWSNISSEKSTDDFEKAYKKKMHKTIRKFVKNMNKTETPIAVLPAPSEYSDETSSVLSGELEVCMACEKNPVNTRTQPCNHRYMCSDCAMKFYKIYKKCKVCRVRIEQYVVED